MRDNLKLTVKINKSGQQTYPNKDKESLVIPSAKIEGGHVLPLYYCGVAQQLQNVIKSIKSWCGDYTIKAKSSIRYFWEVIKRVNKDEDEHEHCRFLNPRNVAMAVSLPVMLCQMNTPHHR